MAASKRLEILPIALQEAEDATAFYAQKDARVAIAFALALNAAIRQVENAPLQWPAYLQGTRRILLKKFPYLVVYRDEPTRILVVAVAHTKRKPGYWKKR